MPSRMLSALVVSALVSTAMAGDPCGDPASGPCNEANNTPGCDDLACCNAVCQLDSFCCDALWDDACVSLAIETCDGGGGGGPANDFCAGATSIGEGVFSYSTVDATIDGPELPGECNEGFGTAFGPDIWYLLEPTEDTGVVVSTCGTVDYDSRLAAYLDCNGTLVACNDDGDGCPDYSSRMTFVAIAGQSYRIRVGGYGEATGSGTLSVEFGEVPPPYPTRIAPVWSKRDGGNGHAYSVVSLPKDSSHADAVLAAERLGGSLATFTSAGEKNFAVGFAPTSDPATYDRAAFGLVQDASGSEPAGGWGWMNGEPLVWTNWRGGEPNDNPAPEDFGELYVNGEWNDCFDDDFGQAVVEFDHDPGIDDGVVWPVSEGGNGHRYQGVVAFPGVDWATAAALAEEAGGRLATFETAEELQWVFDHLVCFNALWEQPGGVAGNNGPMVGLERIGGTWQWLGGTPFDYDAWFPGEPSGDGSVASFFVTGGAQPQPTFNDRDALVASRSYIIEFEAGDGGDCPTDLNGDGTTNGEDFGILLIQWGDCPGCPADFDGDGIVEGPDVGLLLVGWGACP